MRRFGISSTAGGGAISLKRNLLLSLVTNFANMALNDFAKSLRALFGCTPLQESISKKNNHIIHRAGCFIYFIHKTNFKFEAQTLFSGNPYALKNFSGAYIYIHYITHPFMNFC